MNKLLCWRGSPIKSSFTLECEETANVGCPNNGYSSLQAEQGVSKKCIARMRLWILQLATLALGGGLLFFFSNEALPRPPQLPECPDPDTPFPPPPPGCPICPTTSDAILFPLFSSLDLLQMDLEPLVPEDLFRDPGWIKGRAAVESRGHIRLLPTLLQAHICQLNHHVVGPGGCDQRFPLRPTMDLLLPHKRIFLDVGGNTFKSNVGWMEVHYPVTFDEIYAWERVPGLFVKPDIEAVAKEYGLTTSRAQSWLDSITLHTKTVQPVESDATDLNSFILEKVRPEDYCVVIIDVEGEEWNIIPILEQSGAIELIDEFMLEIHFAHPALVGYGWDKFAPHTAEQALEMALRIRMKTVFHYWP
jgi:hypothetical protein